MRLFLSNLVTHAVPSFVYVIHLPRHRVKFRYRLVYRFTFTGLQVLTGCIVHLLVFDSVNFDGTEKVLNCEETNGRVKI